MKIINDGFIRVKTESGKIYSVVKPYWKRYLVYVKLRWQFKKVSQIFSEEFGSLSKEYWDWAIKNQYVLVNNKPCDLDTILHNGDKIEHNTLKIEKAGTNQFVHILEEDDDLMSAYKPPGIPSHPCGMHDKMSLLTILKQSLNTDYLYLLSRLDRVTSGVILLCKNKGAAQRFMKRILSSEKIYFALVYGDFVITPDDNYHHSSDHKNKYRAVQSFIGEFNGTSAEHPELKKLDVAKRHYISFNGDWCVCTAKLKTLKSNYGNPLTVEHNEIEGKECETWFKKISFDGTYSLVIARLLTGRTHQIRAHLEILGFPIVNDHHYSGQDIVYHKNEKLKDFQIEKEIDVCYKIINENDINSESLPKESQMNLDFDLKDLNSIFCNSNLIFDKEMQTLHVKYLVEDPLEICLFAYKYTFKPKLDAHLNVMNIDEHKEFNISSTPKLDNSEKDQTNDLSESSYKCTILPSWLTNILNINHDGQNPITKLDSIVNNTSGLTKE